VKSGDGYTKERLASSPVEDPSTAGVSIGLQQFDVYQNSWFTEHPLTCHAKLEGGGRKVEKMARSQSHKFKTSLLYISTFFDKFS
jgi:hypothetical protein